MVSCVQDRTPHFIVSLESDSSHYQLKCVLVWPALSDDVPYVTYLFETRYREEYMSGKSQNRLLVL